MIGVPMSKGQIYYGPRGGKWADPQHTIPYKEGGARRTRSGRLKGVDRRELRRREDSIRNEPHEHMHVYALGEWHATGPEYTKSVGKHPEYTCALPPGLRSALHTDRNAVLTHNHPSGIIFSDSDVVTSIGLDLAEIRATSPDGFTWVLTRPRNGWREAKFYNRWVDRRGEVFKKIDDQLDRLADQIEARGGDYGDYNWDKAGHALAAIEFHRALRAVYGRHLRIDASGSGGRRPASARREAAGSDYPHLAKVRAAAKGKVTKSIIPGLPLSLGAAVMGPPPSPNREEYPYQGSCNFQGVLIYIENKAGTTRSGKDPNGKPWSVKMKYHYGEIAGTRGADGDPVDAYIGPDPLAPMAYVVHQRQSFGGDEHVPAGTYDEDKVMLGFGTEAAAVKAYIESFTDPPPSPGVTAINIGELRRQVNDGELEYGTALTKAAPAGAWRRTKSGWARGSKKTGNYEWRKDKPDTTPTRPKQYERDPGKSFADLKAGDLVEVGGRAGRYELTPQDSDPTDLVTVTSKRTGEEERVRKDTVFAIRERKTRKRPPPKPTRSSSKKKRKGDRVRVGDWEGPISGGPSKPTRSNPTGERTHMAPAFAHSRADPEETPYLWRLENGQYRAIIVKRRRGGAPLTVVDVPQEDRDPLVKSFEPLVRKVINSPMVRRFGLGDSMEVRDELIAAGLLGLWEGVSTFPGDKAFLAHAERYIQAAILRHVRNSMHRGGPSIPDHLLRNLHGFIAARTRAQKESGKEPTPSQIARHWKITKKEIYKGTRKLGPYITTVTKKNEDGSEEQRSKVIQQGDEQVPNRPWQVKGPTGRSVGKEYPGKLELIDTFRSLLAGDAVEDEQWMIEHEAEVMGSTGALGLGAALELQEEIGEIIDQMGETEGKAWRLHFALDGGTPMTPLQIAREMEIGEGKSDNTKQRKVKAILDRAKVSFTRLAREQGGVVAAYAERAQPRTNAPDFTPPPIAPTKGKSHREMKALFGTDEAVAIYITAVRHGHGRRTAKVLAKMKNGQATQEEIDHLHSEYYRNRLKDRREMYKRHSAIEAPEGVSDFGPQGEAGTSEGDKAAGRTGAIQTPPKDNPFLNPEEPTGPEFNVHAATQAVTALRKLMGAKSPYVVKRLYQTIEDMGEVDEMPSKGSVNSVSKFLNHFGPLIGDEGMSKVINTLKRKEYPLIDRVTDVYFDTTPSLDWRGKLRKVYDTLVSEGHSEADTLTAIYHFHDTRRMGEERRQAIADLAKDKANLPEGMTT